MADKSHENVVSLTKTELQELLTTVLRQAQSLNPLDQKRLDEEIEREKRRTLLAIELARTEEEAHWRRQNSCTHSAHEKTGEAVPKGMGKWTTGGQMHGDESATLICQRCATAWRFKPTREEREYILNGPGLLGYPPPNMDRLLNRDDFAARPPAHVMGV